MDSTSALKSPRATAGEGYGDKPYFVEGHEPEAIHRAMASTLDAAIAEMGRIQADARADGFKGRPGR
jgi:xylulose-5-phosphate/fructose-6-phosphate phosphoketolase